MDYIFGIYRSFPFKWVPICIPLVDSFRNYKFMKKTQKFDTFRSISFELYIRKEKWIAFLESTDHFLSKEIQIYIV